MLSALGVLGVLLAVLWFRAMGRASRAKLIDAEFVFFMAVVLVLNATYAVTQFSGGTTVTTTYDGQYLTSISSIASQFDAIQPALLVVATVAFVLSKIRARTISINAPAIILLVIAMSGTVGNFLSLGTPPGVGALANFALIGACLVARRSMSPVRGAAHGLALLVVLNFLAGFLPAGVVADVCPDRKCGIFDVVYTGAASNFNGLGLLMALAIPVLYLGMARYRMVFTIAAGVLVAAAGSRTGMIAGALAFGFVVVVAVMQRLNRPFGSALPWLAVIFSGGLAIWFPLLGSNNDTFTGRGDLWEKALGMWAESPIFGLGPERWRDLYYAGEITKASVYSTHNQFVEVLFVTGALGLAALVVFVIMVIRRNSAAQVPLALVLIPVAVLSVAERPWSLSQVDWLSWSLLITASVSFVPMRVPRRPSGLPHDSTESPRASATSRGGPTHARSTSLRG